MQHMLRRFAKLAYQDYLLGALKPNHLTLLVQVNIHEALVQNAAALGISRDYYTDDNALSPFNLQGPVILPGPYPRVLEPTELQKMIPHHPWLDLFPIPRFRDNLIRACETVDEYELCGDLADVREYCGEKPSLIIWGDPLDPWAWEATVSFLRKWGWLLRGCPQILDATNYWRGVRGEPTLSFGIY
jgi:hypothetical protein